MFSLIQSTSLTNCLTHTVSQWLFLLFLCFVYRVDSLRGPNQSQLKTANSQKQPVTKILPPLEQLALFSGLVLNSLQPLRHFSCLYWQKWTKTPSSGAYNKWYGNKVPVQPHCWCQGSVLRSLGDVILSRDFPCDHPDTDKTQTASFETQEASQVPVMLTGWLITGWWLGIYFLSPERAVLLINSPSQCRKPQPCSAKQRRCIDRLNMTYWLTDLLT